MDKDAYIVKLEEEIGRLKEQLADLMRRLGLNSTNSSKPSSMDGLQKKPRTQSTRSKSQKPSGGQKGHKGYHLEQVETPDHIHVHDVPFCKACGLSLDTQPIQTVSKRQVFDIPEPKIEIAEHQALTKICTCGCVNQAPFPKEATAPACYGKRIQSFTTYLSNQHFIPLDRLQDVLKDLFEISISTGCIATFNERLAKAVTPHQDQILENLKQASVKHLDETGFRVGGKTQWLHVISNDSQTHYRVSAKRKDLNPLEGISGVVVHDHWKSYFKLPGVTHSLCNAHHLRELKALMEIEKEPWATRMDRLLRCANQLTSPCYDRISRLYDQIVQTGLTFHEKEPAFGKSKRKRRIGHNLLIRLRDYKEDV